MKKSYSGIALVCSLLAAPLAAQQWWSGYHVGDRVMFSISGSAADLQPCVVAEEAADNRVMRVTCQSFKHWAAGKYIVYGPSHLGSAAGAAPSPAALAPTVARPGPPPAAEGSLKPGEYACYGSGGRILIGLGFKLGAGGRYTDLEGGNAGRVVVTAGQVSFVGGHLGGRTARRLGGNNFAFGQTSCEPY